ncbi:hypothetical protein GOP47_0004680 [Adiantum capillus-veneris]|uniref:Alpha/beta hydrolase fold-3 domain-containing protein n=1 Tax=Adiantum capillus-veneris TaxID=13818 RepID=A0A9D4V8I1_ADICA|nr:hypothetical protein GOP47_0004680 [Adiantum capillus-veneris]
MEMGLVSVDACAEFVEGVASRDVPLDEDGCVWVRIFRPQDPQGADTMPKAVVLYAHGGAYTIGQPHWYPFHAFCSTACKTSHSIWVSLSYRLAPTHRLPAAYDDGSLALNWLRAQALHQHTNSSDPWLSREHADFSNCFLAGESAGANIMLKVAMDAASSDLTPMYIKGLLLLQPGFHSEEKRASAFNEKTEERYNNALPIGETLDYAPVNPVHHMAPPLTPLSAYPHIFINAAETDFRYDMTIRFYDMIKDFCPNVQLSISRGKGHWFHLGEPHCIEAQDLQAEMARFIYKCTFA